jgi:hypothetical protein
MLGKFLDTLCSYIRESGIRNLSPLLISETLFEVRAPQSAFEEGVFDAALHH